MRLAIVLALALLVAGCGMQSLAWQVDRSTTVSDLDKRYADELAALEGSTECEVGDQQAGGYVSSVTDCYQYHRIWRRYWRARREIAELHQ